MTSPAGVGRTPWEVRSKWDERHGKSVLKVSDQDVFPMR